jgi:hypothetical protein
MDIEAKKSAEEITIENITRKVRNFASIIHLKIYLIITFKKSPHRYLQ